MGEPRLRPGGAAVAPSASPTCEVDRLLAPTLRLAIGHRAALGGHHEMSDLGVASERLHRSGRRCCVRVAAPATDGPRCLRNGEHPMEYDNLNKSSCDNSPFTENAPANVTLTESTLNLVSGGFLGLPLVAYAWRPGNYNETAKGMIQSIGR
jgi:hypothetical protein